MTRSFPTRELVICLALIHEISCAVDNLKCTDRNNEYIDNGQEFYPKKEDPCYICVCNKGFAETCRSVSCKPKCKHYKQVDGVCCQFICLDDKGATIPKSDGGLTNYTQPVEKGGNPDGSPDSITTLGLRLVASTVTSFLVLALLLFMVHRIRQKRLMQAMRRYHNSRRREQLDDLDQEGFTQQFVGIQSPPPYEDPPPPYSPPKPSPRIHPAESPPPYEVIDSNQNVNNNNNNNELQCQTDQTQCQTDQRQCQTDQTQTSSTDNRNCNGNTNNVSIRNRLDQENNVSCDERNNIPPRFDSFRTVVQNTNSSFDNSVDGNLELASIVLSENRVIYNPCIGENRATSNISSNSSVTSSASDNKQVQRNFDISTCPFKLNKPCNGAGNNASSRQLCYMTPSCYSQPFPLVLGKPSDLDRTDDSSSVASESFSPNHVRSFQDNHYHNTNMLHGYIYQYPNDFTDSEDLSTEASTNIVQTQNNLSALLAGKKFVNPTIPHFESSSQDGIRPPAKICYIDPRNKRYNTEVQQNVASEFANIENVAPGQSVSDCSTSHTSRADGCNIPALPNSSFGLQDISVSETGTSSTDNVPKKEFGDAQQLRELRLSNLLRSPSGESSEDPSSPMSPRFPSQNMPRSNSDISMFSVCSETGEKKLSHLSGVALRNDAQYPENSCKGRQPLILSLPSNHETLDKFDYNASVNQTFNSDMNRVVPSHELNRVVPSHETHNRKKDSELSKNYCDSGACSDGSGNGRDVGCYVPNGSSKKSKDGEELESVILGDISKCDGNKAVSECGSSSSEKNIVSDKKLLINKDPVKSYEKCVSEMKENRSGNKKKISEAGVKLRHGCKNKHKIQRHSTGSLPGNKLKWRSLQQDGNDACKINPHDSHRSHDLKDVLNNCDSERHNLSGSNRKFQPVHCATTDNASKTEQQQENDIYKKFEPSRSFRQYGFIDVPKVRKGCRSHKSGCVMGCATLNDLSNGRRSLVANDFNSLRDPTNLHGNINSNFSAIEKASKVNVLASTNVNDHSCLQKNQKNLEDANLFCPKKGLIRRKSRNSKRNKNRKSYPGAHVSEPHISKDFSLMSSSVVSYEGAKKETEFSSDGVIEKLTFPVKDGVNEDTAYVIEKCSYV